MTLAARHHPGADGIDLTRLLRLQHVEEAAAIQVGGRRHPADLHKGGREIHEVDEVIHDSPRPATGDAGDEGDAGAEVVEVALATRHARHAVIATDDNDGALQLTEELILCNTKF